VSSTRPPDVPIGRIRLYRNLRRLIIAGLVAVLALALAGVLGTTTATVTAARGGYELTVTYPKVTRPGLAIEWSVEVRHRGGFDGPVRISTTSDYLGLFDENGLDPDPSSTTQTASDVVWEFDPPDGDTLTVSFDARTEPARQSGRAGRTAVLDGSRPVVEASYRTRVMP
jgi:hypothetical protein